MHTAVLHPLTTQNMGSLSTVHTIYNLCAFFFFFNLSIILVLHKGQHTEILESYSETWCMNLEWSEFHCLSLC